LARAWSFSRACLFLTESEREQLQMSAVDRSYGSTVISHETAHQWWGDLVGWNGYRDQWIVEALADYSSLMFLESRNSVTSSGTARAPIGKPCWKKIKDGALLMDGRTRHSGLAPVLFPTFPNGYDAISYGPRATWLFHMLRCMMRDYSAPRTVAPAGKSKEVEETIRARFA